MKFPEFLLFRRGSNIPWDLQLCSLTIILAETLTLSSKTASTHLYFKGLLSSRTRRPISQPEERACKIPLSSLLITQRGRLWIWEMLQRRCRDKGWSKISTNKKLNCSSNWSILKWYKSSIKGSEIKEKMQGSANCMENITFSHKGGCITQKQDKIKIWTNKIQNILQSLISRLLCKVRGREVNLKNRNRKKLSKIDSSFWILFQ